jgi:hypothetical protein
MPGCFTKELLIKNKIKVECLITAKISPKLGKKQKKCQMTSAGCMVFRVAITETFPD